MGSVCSGKNYYQIMRGFFGRGRPLFEAHREKFPLTSRRHNVIGSIIYKYWSRVAMPCSSVCISAEADGNCSYNDDHH